MVVHAGNAVNQMAFEEHEGTLNAKRVSMVGGAGLTSLPTLFAVVNTGAGGGGNVTLNPSGAFIGIVTIANPSSFTGNITLDAGSKTGIVGSVTLADSKTFIGLVTTVVGSNVSLNASAAFIGLVTVAGIGTLTLADPRGFIGLTTTVLGNASVATKNAGTTKTLQIFPITISTGSAATVYVPTNKFYLTSILLNSNATVRVNVRSGATYLTGNATLGINLNPGSGWVEMGSPDSPVYFGLAAAAPIVIEKTDSSGVISQIGGKLVLFDE